MKKKRLRTIEEILHTSHSMRNQIKARAMHLTDEEGPVHTQWFMLKILEHFKERTIKDFSETLGITSSAVTQFIGDLEENGYVTKTKNPVDGRSVIIRLTEQGRDYIAETSRSRILEMVDLFDPLTEEELSEYLRLQRKILSSITHSHGKNA